MQKLKEFGLLILDILENGVWGLNIGKLIVGVMIFLSFLILRRIFTKFIISRIQSFTKKTKTQLDDEILEALEKPIRFVPVIMGLFFALEYLQLNNSLAAIGDKVVRSLIVMVIFWGLGNIIGPMSFLLTRLERIFTNAMIEWLIKAIRVAFIFLGVATVLELWGIKVGPIIAGLGLFGVAVALGAQDLFKNLISGILVLAEKRFMQGDWILVEGVVEGTVETIGFRSTRIRRFDKAPVFVPNHSLADNVVINFTQMTHRRIYWKIGVEYNTTTDQLRNIREMIEQYLLDNPDFAKPPEVPLFVRIDSFNDSSIDIMVYCFTKTTNWGEWLRKKEDLAYKIKEIIEGQGCAFAFPSQSIYVESTPDSPTTDQPETFIPPE